MIRLEKIGMRTIKTALAVTLTLLICAALRIDNPFFAAIAAIIVMEPSVSESLSSGKSRMYGTVLGGLFAMGYSLILPSHPILIGLGIIVLIYVSNLFKIQNSIKISSIIFISILLNYEDGSRIHYAVYRTLDTFIGIAVGTLVNYYVRPPNTGKSIGTFIDQTQQVILRLLEKIKANDPSLDYAKLIDDLVAIEEKHRVLQKEIKLNLYPQNEVEAFEKAFTALESAYNHMSILVMLGNNISNPTIYAYHLDEIDKLLVRLSKQKPSVQ